MEIVMFRTMIVMMMMMRRRLGKEEFWALATWQDVGQGKGVWENNVADYYRKNCKNISLFM